jgi:hypothetical protein
MPAPAIVLNALFFPLVIAANILLAWAFLETTKAGIWPKGRFFGFLCRRPFQLLSVIKVLQQRIQDAENATEARRFRRCLHAITPFKLSLKAN